MAGAGTCRMCFGSIEPGQEVVKDPMGDFHVGHLTIALQARKREEGKVYVFDCDDCGGPPAGEPETCPKSEKPCGHHCNHSWSHEHCHYCGKEWGAE